MVWVETPTNPLLRIIDIEAMCKIGHSVGATVVVDNTFASPYLQNPSKFGADVVMHSATKYINGHSDVVMGVLCVNDEALKDRLAFIQNSCGATPGPMDSFLVLRGIKTLHIRMQRHCENGKVVANYLANHPKVGEVYWPGFESHKNHEVAKKQMKDFGGMISFTLQSDSVDSALTFLKSTKLFALAESLGGVESLVGHPATMTHASIPKAEREANGLKDSLIRLSVGIEHIDDLIADLETALSHV
jgi:cystathionine beta-lyase